MAFPTVPTAAANRLLTSQQATSTLTHTFPSQTTLAQAAGDLMVAIILVYQGNAGDTMFGSWGGGFTETAEIGSATEMAIGVAHKWADGTETGTFTVTTADSLVSSMFLMTIPGAHPTTPPELLTAGAQWTVNNTVSVGDQSPSWGSEDNLYVLIGGCGETSTAGSFTGLGAPSAAYTNELQSGINVDAVSGTECGVAFRQNAGSSGAATYSMDLSNSRGVGVILAVRPEPTEETLLLRHHPMTQMLAH